jgi:putative transposase
VNLRVYQDRYKAKLVKTDAQYVTLVRYIEANPVAAGLVPHAELWPWSSLTERLSGRRRILVKGPCTLPDNWVDLVNTQSRAEEGTEVEGGTEVGGGQPL